ncbi:hypothetical protein SUGI_0014800 [Cryptomeria japonica]|nr:hypothetical protein SUGI_0014800 [Cryptomeria japonica]
MRRHFHSWFLRCLYNKISDLFERNPDCKNKPRCNKPSSRIVDVPEVNGKGVSMEIREKILKGAIIGRELNASSLHPLQARKEFFIHQPKSVQNTQKKHKAQENKMKESEAKPACGGKSFGDILKCKATKIKEAEPLENDRIISSKECEKMSNDQPEKPEKRKAWRPLKRYKTRKIVWYPVLETIQELQSFK